MGCQKKIAASVLHKGANYLLSVKDNQPKLVKAFKQAFPVSELVHFEGDAYVTDEKNLGCQEMRHHIVKELTKEFQELSYEWPGLRTVGVVMSFRSEGDKAPTEPMVLCYISSA